MEKIISKKTNIKNKEWIFSDVKKLLRNLSPDSFEERNSEVLRLNGIVKDK